MKVLCFGELLLRLSAQGYNKLFQKDSLDATFCGGEANVAVSLANFRVDSEFVTKLPDNDVGKAAEKSLKYFGVNTDKIIFGNGRMGLYYLEKGASQRPSKVIYDRAYSAIALADKSEFDWDKIFDGVSWFHWTGINPALGDNVAEICEEACKAAKSKGITISCDLNFRKNLWTSEKAQSVMKKLMPYVDVCIANEEDADKVLGIKADDTDVENGELSIDGYKKVADEICSTYRCEKVAITLRKSYSASRNDWSAIIYDNATKACVHSTEYDIQIVDRVGGGDSFTAGVIYGLITGMSDKNTVEFAAAASCLKHTIEGDFNRVTVQDVESLLKNGGNGRVQR
ncbi:MAG: sugar kinase [Ruminococcus sp.]|nr:sugar kinase [Ruminococcus sp.]